MKTKFEIRLAPPSAGCCGGFASSGAINPCKWADELYGGEVPGPWLCCYLLRRFGWPNVGSDDYKELCAWILTTPMPGLYLRIDPYLGGSNLHFAVRFSRVVQKKINQDPGREAFFERKRKALVRWWVEKGRKLYVIGTGKKDGDEDVLVHAYATQGDKVCGLWQRSAHHRGKGYGLPRQGRGIALWWLGEFVSTAHPEANLPAKLSKRELAARMSRFDLRVRQAIRVTLRDLLRPTNVRDLDFSIFGRIDRAPALEKSAHLEHAPFFPGAGYAPRYWFTTTAKERSTPVRRPPRKASNFHAKQKPPRKPHP